MFRLIDITIDIIFFSINWKNYFDRSILVISMTVLPINSERASAAARSAASASEHSCNVCVYAYRYNVYIQSVYVPEKF